ncbi:hypothetical protein [Aureimonas sp. D3]|uniref:hypothetical protein n=1 Tax=Aureimonas sp. D3 TaxID=1638164 RepID=UPI0007814638|nr:hypothetical protein [Aureimonas sp. D3]
MSRRQKTKRYDWSDFNFDQSAPDFEPVRRVDLEDSETPADVLAQTRTPAGFVDRERDAQLLPTTRAYDGTPTYLADRNTHAAQVVDGVKASCSMPRIAVRGGVAFSLRLNGVEFLRSKTMSDEEADQSEPGFRAALYALAAGHG